ncbi:response regulator [Pseudolysinimonas sp.]|jgi:response regulator of citrate/malate metabolism
MTVRLRVLVVDDDPSVARLHAAFVASRDDAVIATVGTGPDAVVAIREGRPDVVLLDMHLPGFSGLEVLRRTRAERGPQPEFLAVTAARDIDTVREARRLGVRHYLAKPFTADDLRTRLDELRNELAAAPNGRLEQREIDAVMAGDAATRPLPKGISAQTLATVAAAVAVGPPRSAGDVAEALGLSRVSVRRYLEHLVDTGRATRTMDYGTAGRPRTLYAAPA